MKILIDTNILLYNESDHHPPAHLQVLIRLINDLNYRLLIHPLSITEVEKDNNIPHKHLLLARMKEYSQVVTQLTPIIDDTFFKKVGKPDNERDQVDNHLLYCVYKNEVDFFITEDPDIVQKAHALNISDKVMNSKKALSYFQDRKQKKIEQGDGPIYCFYKDGEIWHIGEKGSVKEFKHLMGFEYIHILLSRVHQSKTCQELFYAVNGSGEGEQNKIFLDENEEKYGEGMNTSKKPSRKTIQFLKNKRDTLNEEISNPENLSLNELDDKKETLEKIEKYLKEIKWIKEDKADIDPNIEDMRISVYKAIKRAKTKISEKSSKPFSEHFKAIETGNSCTYNPSPDNKPSWILHTEDLDK